MKRMRIYDEETAKCSIYRVFPMNNLSTGWDANQDEDTHSFNTGLRSVASGRTSVK